MNSHKYAQLVREFPFLAKIFVEMNPPYTLDADSIADIEVKRGDRNLLEVKPSYQANDADSYGEYVEYRHFWCVAPGESVRMTNSHWRTIPYHRNDYEDTPPIGAQLLELNRDVLFIVEISASGWDPEERAPSVVIYKMKGFDWRQFCRPAQATQS